MTSGRAGTGQTTRVAAQTASSSTELPRTGIDTGYLLAAGVGGIAAGTALVKGTAAADGPDDTEPEVQPDPDDATQD